MRWLFSVCFAFSTWLLVWYLWEWGHRCHSDLFASSVAHLSPLREPSSSNLPFIPPLNSSLFANPFDAYPPTDAFYPNEVVSSAHPRLRYLLAHWVRLSKIRNFRFVLMAGSLLGALRNGRIIPWDADLDVAIDRASAERIIQLALGNVLAGWPGGTTNDGVAVEWNSAVIDHQPWRDGEVRLIVNSHRAQSQPGDGIRYDQTGKVVPSQLDSVSFNGPFARLICKNEERLSHLDVFCVAEFAGALGDIEEGPERASFPSKLEPCTLEGYQLWCPSKEEYVPVLEHAYGKDYIIPKH